MNALSEPSAYSSLKSGPDGEWGLGGAVGTWDQDSMSDYKESFAAVADPEQCQAIIASPIPFQLARPATPAHVTLPRKLVSPSDFQRNCSVAFPEDVSTLHLRLRNQTNVPKQVGIRAHPGNPSDSTFGAENTSHLTADSGGPFWYGHNDSAHFMLDGAVKSDWTRNSGMNAIKLKIQSQSSSYPNSTFSAGAVQSSVCADPWSFASHCLSKSNSSHQSSAMVESASATKNAAAPTVWFQARTLNPTEAYSFPARLKSGRSDLRA